MLNVGRRGFTLVELLVVLAIGTLLAAVVIPSLIGSVDQSRVEESAESLGGVADAVASMRKDMGQYPQLLTHLSDPVTSAHTGLCGASYADPSLWTGPYLNRTIPTTGLPLPIGTADNVLGYTAGPPLLWINLPGVRHEDARALDRRVDADGDSVGGAIRWGSVVSGLVDLSYVIPVRPC